jgi:hypothetical protein
MASVDVRKEFLACTMSPYYFVHQYCYIYDAVQAKWVPFKLWKGQVEVLNTLKDERLVIILKARQLGQTWLVLTYALWLMIFHPAVTILLFSRRDDEAQQLLERLRGIYKRLPDWAKVRRVIVDNNHEWNLSNGSVAYAFPTTAGDSYTASMAIVDEADLVPNLDFLMNAVKPTIDNGGRMILLSRANKEEPQSPFKRMYRAARDGESPWKAIFLPWYMHPGRNRRWFEEQERDVYARTGSVDDLWQQYPATDTQALAPRMMDKRIPAPWIDQCYVPIKPIANTFIHSIHPKIQVYREPEKYHEYVMGNDPAEGNPTSDDSSLTILDKSSGEEVLSLAERIEPSNFAQISMKLLRLYNDAGVLPERNNHGHVVIAAMNDAGDINILAGLDQNAGWHTNSKSKAEMYSTAADAFRDQTTVLHSEDTYFQLCGVVGSTLKAPENEHDDRAISYSLALQAISAPPAGAFSYSYLMQVAVTKKKDRRLERLGVSA